MQAWGTFGWRHRFRFRSWNTRVAMNLSESGSSALRIHRLSGVRGYEKRS
jgi:hypothetical protein